MNHQNIEIKARCADASYIRSYLLGQQAIFKGVDEQTDTYFEVSNGRLKLRQGTIENSLIFYKRANTAGPKLSEVQLLQVEIEAIDLDGTLGLETIKQQCEYYLQQFNIQPHGLLTHSYSDLLMNAS